MHPASYPQSDLYSFNDNIDPLGREPIGIPAYPPGGITSNVIPEGVAYMDYTNNTCRSPYVPADTNSDEFMNSFASIQLEPTMLDNSPDETGSLKAFQSHPIIPQISESISTGYEFSVRLAPEIFSLSHLMKHLTDRTNP